MGSLYQKSIETLELPQVLEQVARHAVSDRAKEAILALSPLDDVEDIREKLRECADALALMRTRQSPVFSGLRDVTASVRRAERGGSLGPKELLEVASLLRAARAVRDYGSPENRGPEEKTSLDPQFAAISANKFLEESITNAILSEEEIADDASAELSAIRRQIKSVNARVRDVLHRIISSPSYSKYLQEPLITLRSDRYVVPVKSECRGDVAGLVHDVSSSGATLFVEPVQVVEANNELKVLASREQKEIERILFALSAEVANFAEGILDDFRILTGLDVIFAKAKYSLEIDGFEPRLTTDGVVDLRRARHPLLPRGRAVPIDIRIGRDFDTLVITGPNTGGKTVALKTLGLLTLMAECGLPIPASESSSVSVFSAVYADIGDEQSITQSLSTFSSHMTNIVGILGELDEHSLALFDELGAGTDPVEGAALAVAIIEHVRGRGARVAATTHYAELKVYALGNPGVENAACEFDVETLRPTYRLLIGVPGKSNAFAISARLGLPGEIIEAAKASLHSDNVRFEDVLSDLERERQRMERERQEAEQLRREAQEHQQKAEEQSKTLEAERDRQLERARREARGIVEAARAEVARVYEELEAMRRQAAADAMNRDLLDAKAALGRRLNALDERVDGTAGRRAAHPVRPAPSRPLKAGDVVELLSTGTHATVLEPPDKNGNLTLQAGIMKISAKVRDVALLERETEKEAVKLSVSEPMVRTEGGLRSAQASVELDLRGKNADEALVELERFLDSAVLAGLHNVTVIHGKGTGVLRAAVQTALRADRRVHSFRLGRYGEGEDGVTLVEL